ncbi:MULTISPECIES: P13 family porin [Borreliella]|uniref:P13 family porin n=1 Tax=Borreliella TaxID=64895 RepID=UPI001CF2998B|nr:P13 family porin [Borreliella bavariensis]
MITKNTPLKFHRNYRWSILCYHLLNLFLTLGIGSFVQGGIVLVVVQYLKPKYWGEY